MSNHEIKYFMFPIITIFQLLNFLALILEFPGQFSTELGLIHSECFDKLFAGFEQSFSLFKMVTDKSILFMDFYILLFCFPFIFLYLLMLILQFIEIFFKACIYKTQALMHWVHLIDFILII